MMYPGLRTSFDYRQGLTAPYPTYFEEGRTNRGFTDLRGRPDLAAQVAEAAECPALRALLVALADTTSPLFSLGCDVGEHEEPKEDDTPIPVAGGYIDIIARDYSFRDENEYRELASVIEDAMSKDANGHRWAIDFGIKFCCIELDGNTGDEIVPALDISFFAAGDTAELARQNREVMLSSLLRAIQGDAVKGVIAVWVNDDDSGTPYWQRP